MRSLWVGGGVAARNVRLESLSPRLDKRHHHHHHHHGPDEVVIKGNDDHVNLHDRSFGSAGPHGSPVDPLPDRTVVEGANDNAHDHGQGSHHKNDPVEVEGDSDRVHAGRSFLPRRHHHYRPDTAQRDNDHTHARREPLPHHHHHHPDSIVVDGDNAHVHLRRSPAPHHRHHHLDKAVVEGSHDHVRVHRSPHHHDHTVVVEGSHDRVHVHRRSSHRRHHHKTFVRANKQHIHLNRAPAAASVPRYRPDQAEVKGDNDHVRIHRKRSRDDRHPVVIPGDNGKTYLVSPKLSEDQPSSMGVGLALGVAMHTRRDTQISGVPGTVDIMVSWLSLVTQHRTHRVH